MSPSFKCFMTAPKDVLAAGQRRALGAVFFVVHTWKGVRDSQVSGDISGRPGTTGFAVLDMVAKFGK